ncbi:MAG TPA: STAS domain-containing protein [Candidatus Binataceae bacterium]|nr:STAS domain-containing protein [Candidatus Binataceae bacterium]
MQSHLPEIIRKYQKQLHTDWMAELAAGLRTDTRISESELSQQTGEFLRVLADSTSSGKVEGADSLQWEPVRDFLTGISRSRAMQGFSAEQTATFIFSLKQVLFQHLRQQFDKNPKAMADEIWNASVLIDSLGMHTFNTYQQAREEVISRQQQELLELSTPVVKLWDGVLALPMIGTLDSARTQTVMETLLQRIVETGSSIAIIDITGVPTVDTLVAQHLLKTVTAIRLMGADCIISGIRPQIAQTIVHLGITLEGVITRATLADALALALKRSGQTITAVKA